MPLCHNEHFDQKESLRASEYVTGNIIGNGATSIVKLAMNTRTKNRIAVKIVNLSLYSKLFEKEVSVLSKVNHGNIVKLLWYEYELQDGNNVVLGALYLEYLPFPSLMTHLLQYGSMNEHTAFLVLRQMVDTFNYLHGLGLSHGDFKPENVVYDPVSHNIKILDFGLSQCPSDDRHYYGSPIYQPPEIHFRKHYDIFLADIWSMGICFYEMLTGGDNPFSECQDIEDIVEHIFCCNNGNIEIEIENEDEEYSFLEAIFQKNYSKLTFRLLKKMLAPNPSCRSSAKELYDTLIST